MWSHSRHRTWVRCRREYWYNYYGARGGWRGRSEPTVRSLYLFKGLKTVHQWVGILTHEVAEQVVGLGREGRAFDPEAVLETTRRRARRQIEDALSGLYRLNPKKHQGFLDIEYDTADSELWAMALDDLTTQVSNLLVHPVLQRLLDVPERIIEVEQLERVPIRHVPTWVSLDVLVADGRGGYVVVDWKTGRTQSAEQSAEQLALYAAYVCRRYDTTPDRVRGLFASTRTGEYADVGLDRASAERVESTAVRSAAEMLAVLPDPTVDEAPEELFAPLPEGSPACPRCRYRRPCGRDS